MSRYCASCGTEVDDSAVFCPSCGQAIDRQDDTEMPAAPAWPDPDPEALRAGAADDDGWDAAPATAGDEPTRAEPRVHDRDPAPASPPQRGSASPPASNRIDIPVTWPVTLSAWLIGVGAVVAALGVVIGFFDGFINPVDALLLLALIGIAVVIFFSASVPAIPQLRLVTLVIALIGFGIALDRMGIGRVGIGELLVFLGTAAAAIGAVLLELGRDQPLGPSDG